nr:MAG TPA: hypothetical protein [Caudoviricetes sp.]
MAKLSLNSISPSVFRVNAAEPNGISAQRAEIVSKGRVLAYEHARRGKAALCAARGQSCDLPAMLDATGYRLLNEQFQQEHLLFAAGRACAQSGRNAPADFDAFKRQGMNYYSDKTFLATLQGIYQEIITPIIPAVYSEAVDLFADVQEVTFGETAQISISSNEIPVFQDSSWGASWSVPSNFFYNRDYTLNPQPKTAQIKAKWHQLVGNNQDFGLFFANIVAGMYAKTMGMWNQVLTAAAKDTSLVPTDLNYSFSSLNWATATNKVSTLNNAPVDSIFAVGNRVALSKVLPTQATGSTNVNMDAALATLLGRQYNAAGYLGEFLSVPLIPLRDAIIPGTQNTNPTTVLSPNDIWMMSTSGRKPMTIAYTAETPISIEIEPIRSSDWMLGLNLTIALDTVATFSSKLAHITI